MAEQQQPHLIQQLQAAIANANQAAAQANAATQAVEAANQDHHAPHAHGILKPTKPSTFSGDRDSTRPLVWLFEVTTFFAAVDYTSARLQISYTAALLRGPAATWYRSHRLAVDEGHAEDFEAWSDFADAITREFQPANFQRIARDRLAALTQRTSVQDYAYRFRMACLEIDNIGEDEKVDRFIRGLKPAIQRELELHPPDNLQRAIEVAERVDAVEYRMLRRNRAAPRNDYRPRNEWRTTPITTADGPTPMQVDAIRFPKLTAAARAQLQAEGKCFYCKEPGHIALDCPKKKKTRPGNARPR